MEERPLVARSCDRDRARLMSSSEGGVHAYHMDSSTTRAARGVHVDHVKVLACG
jgi:hypothetical protein